MPGSKPQADSNSPCTLNKLQLNRGSKAFIQCYYALHLRSSHFWVLLERMLLGILQDAFSGMAHGRLNLPIWVCLASLVLI